MYNTISFSKVSISNMNISTRKLSLMAVSCSEKNILQGWGLIRVTLARVKMFSDI